MQLQSTVNIADPKHVWNTPIHDLIREPVNVEDPNTCVERRHPSSGQFNCGKGCFGALGTVRPGLVGSEVGSAKGQAVGRRA